MFKFLYKSSKKEMIENLLSYTTDPMSLLTAAMLIKRKFTLDEVINNFYSSYDFYNDNWF